MNRTLPSPRRLIALALVAVSTMAGLTVASATAHADEREAIAKVTELNKKALSAYETLELDDARNALMQALQICASEGLGAHPIKARTHLHLGVILAGGFEDKERAIIQFKKALETQPDIVITGSLSNPEIDKYFAEAQAQMPAKVDVPDPVKEPVKEPETVPDPPPEPEVEPVDASDAAPPEDITGIFHEPIASAPKGDRIEIRAAVGKDIEVKRLILAYRPEGAGGFLARDMEKEDSGWWTARIPEPATQGGLIHYYIEARDMTGLALANNGSASEAHVIALGGAVAEVSDEDLIADDSDEEIPGALADPSGKRFFVSLGFGFGYGQVSGTPELTPFADENADGESDGDINFSGAAPGGFVILPEVGYFLSENLMLSLQARIEFIGGLTPAKVIIENEDDRLLQPASSAIAVLAKGTYFFGTDKLRPFASVALGGGQMRHSVDIGNVNSTCGDADDDVLGEDACIDTVLSGPILIGGGGGATYMFTDMLGVQASINILLGLPNFAANADFALGIIAAL